MPLYHSNVIMSAMTSQITSASIVYSPVCSGADQRKHKSSASHAFLRGIQRWQVDSLHKGPATRKMSSFNDVIIVFLRGRVSTKLAFLNRINSMNLKKYKHICMFPLGMSKFKVDLCPCNSDICRPILPRTKSVPFIILYVSSKKPELLRLFYSWLYFSLFVTQKFATFVLAQGRWFLHQNRLCLSLLGLYSLSCKTSHRQISWSIEAARLGIIIIVAFWNLTGISVALLSRCLSNFKAIGKV